MTLPGRQLVVVLVMLAAGCAGTPRAGDESSHAAATFSPQGAAAARHFLSTYVAEDGRVLRHDQGDDIVSEGQAYGMLVAELVGDDASVRRTWSWTRDHLRRTDGLLSFHADRSGNVLDPDSAADADVLAAYALLRYDGDGAAGLHADGSRLAAAVLEHETAPVGGSGGVVPVAGSWVHGEPYAVNPSYWMPGIARALAGLTGDDRWASMADTIVRLVGQLTDDGRRLPPDWAQLRAGSVRATGSPDGSKPAQYGPDAQRVPVFFEAGCDPDASRLAASWWQLLAPADRAAALALAPDGQVVDGSRAPLALLAASAAARAAGQRSRAGELVGEATAQTRASPTYYGDAWLALGAGLAERRLVGC